jgi:outer membrane protein
MGLLQTLYGRVHKPFHRSIKAAVASTVTAWALTMACSTAHSADLLSLYREAMKNDATLAAAQADHAAGLEALPQARSQFFPSVGLSASAIRNKLENSVDVLGRTITTDPSFTSEDYSLSLTQPIYRKQIWAQYDQAKAQVRYSDAQLALAEQDLMIKVAQAYFDALLAQDNVDLMREQKNAITAQLRQAKRLYESGFGTVTDVNEAQSRYDSADAQDIAARNTLEIRMRALEEITGKLPERLQPLGAQASLNLPEPADAERWIEHALANNPAIIARQAGVEAALQEVEKARAGHFPSVDLIASYGYSVDPGYTTLNTTNQSTTIGIRANLPLYQGGYVNSRVRQTVNLRERARSELDAIRRRTIQQTRQEYLNVVNGIAQVQALEQALQSHETTLYSIQKGFQAGLRTNVDILNEQQLLYTAKRDLYQVRYGYLLSRMKLKAAAGLLDETEIALVNSWLAAAP